MTLASLPHSRKLVIQIPCFNEASSLEHVLSSLPHTVEGYDDIAVLLVDDGSTDASVAVARAHGVSHIICHKKNRGLAQTFMTGLQAAIALGAHTIVNLDGDNQYYAKDISLLTAPILAGEAGAVIGTRPIRTMSQFSSTKKILQELGSGIIRFLSKTQVKDVASGFRAIRADIAGQIVVHARFTYTLEMIFQLSRSHIPIVCVPVRVNTVNRPSRLARNNSEYLARSLLDLFFVLFTREARLVLLENSGKQQNDAAF